MLGFFSYICFLFYLLFEIMCRFPFFLKLEPRCRELINHTPWSLVHCHHGWVQRLSQNFPFFSLPLWDIYEQKKLNKRVTTVWFHLPEAQKKTKLIFDDRSSKRSYLLRGYLLFGRRQEVSSILQKNFF